MKFKIAVSKEEDGFYVVECINLPGCISQGKTKEEAMKNIKDAINGYLISLKKHKEEIPIKNILQISEISV
ncbi:MAG: type II toxin-antitoxin system HicB family antitoxin [Candidatus Aenigmarchaeota archaeon]|nr:type II toxin-antitoxin system HicB family antitoxin [Candidatus Aenigmarchaeota archaeon]